MRQKCHGSRREVTPVTYSAIRAAQRQRPGFLQTFNLDMAGGVIHLERISQRTAKHWYVNFENIAIQRTNIRAKAHGVGAEEVDMDISGTPKAFVFEVMMFEIGDRMRHMIFPAFEGPCPN